MIDWICSENLLMMSRKLLMITKSFHEVVFDVDDVVEKLLLIMKSFHEVC